MQHKKFKGSINLLKRNFNIVNFYDLYNETEEFDGEKGFDAGYLAHCFRREMIADYEPTKSKSHILLRERLFGIWDLKIEKMIF